MNMPALLVGVILAGLYGALFHIWRGGNPGWLLMFVLLSIGGFAAGHATASLIGWNFFQIGTLNAGMGTIGSFLTLLVGSWLFKTDV